MLEKFSDQKLIKEIKIKVKAEKKLTSEIITFLEEINHRRLYVDYGVSSLYKFCVRILQYSDAEAFLRVKAVRVANRAPEIKEKLEQGELTLSSVASLDSFLQIHPKANTKNLIQKISGKSTKEAKRFLDTQAANSKPREEKIILKERLLKKIELIQKDLDDCSELEAIEVLVDEYLKKKNSARAHREERGSTRQRYITRRAKEAVDKRAEQRCEGINPRTKKRCSSRTQLHYDHVRPIAFGGDSTEKNLRLLCFSCNQRAAIKQGLIKHSVRDKFKRCSEKE